MICISNLDTLSISELDDISVIQMLLRYLQHHPCYLWKDHVIFLLKIFVHDTIYYNVISLLDFRSSSFHSLMNGLYLIIPKKIYVSANS